ncbi:MAG TPA: CDP-alcohol phosphatidyltransferase family protein, partial [Polyangiaceae bacterium]|nr:CDP-alcohol phosphatidyltransferase family protein [Polyangiaceae bacterium]
AALVGCAWLHAAWPVALFALPSFAGLLWLGRGSFTPSGRFGVANGVTALRLLLVLVLAVPPGRLPAPRALAIVSAVMLLDLLDGWCARRSGDASEFGAHFDMESDALLVLLLTLRLWLAEGFGPWVLWAGLLRYLYVVWLWLWPGTGREAPRSLFGRLAFALLMLGLCCGLVLPGIWGAGGVLFGTLAVTWSFARSGYFSRAAS